MSVPMQEATPGFGVARAWSCGGTALNRTSSALLSFSGALERLNAIQNRIWAMRDALLTIRLPLETFYASLSDEQRQRLRQGEPQPAQMTADAADGRGQAATDRSAPTCAEPAAGTAVTLDRTTVLQLDADRTDGARHAAADCDVLRNDAALDCAPSPIRRSEARNSPYDTVEDLQISPQATVLSRVSSSPV
jgi:hypothetical protein